MPTFGPGTLTLGETAALIDVSTLINGCRITTTKDQGDPVTKLSGAITPGSVTYAWEFTGNIDIDPDDPDGIFYLSQASAGSEVKFTFTPNTAGVASAAGTVIIDPLDFGADEFGATMSSDFTWAIKDKPTFTKPPVTPLAADDDVTVTE